MTAVSDPPSATVVLDGEIDIATAPAIRRFLMAAISGGPKRGKTERGGANRDWPADGG